MKRGICVLVLVLFASPTAAPAGAADDPLAAVLKHGGYAVSLNLKVKKKQRSSLQRVVDGLLGDGGPNAFATGFAVGGGLVLTAYHAVSGQLSPDKRKLLGFSPADQLEVEAYVNGCEAAVLRVDADADLALLRVCGLNKQAGAPAFHLEPDRDERLLVVARPNGVKEVRRGVFAGPYTYRGRQYWSAKLEGRDGFSGSPVYNDRGEIVGVFTGYDSARKVALISPATRVRKLLEDYASGLGAAPVPAHLPMASGVIPSCGLS
jgi:S1-C subfamily serine protease